ncbi:MAG: electron transfer flavoprotein subunit beta/FixA family protein [Anaerolineaceae bacterium]|nr:electron transfer flavoprotein subunit beta/FixA family protein [Anaerolineaceae bacterium]
MINHILVCVKQILDTNHDLVISGNQIVQSGEERPIALTNPSDLNALEKAIELKKQFGAQVIVISLGNAQVSNSLKYCLARGADQAIHLQTPEDFESDSWSTAFNLSKMIKSMPFDLILCGEKNINSNSGLVGPLLAGMLNIPQITSVIEIHPQIKTKTIQARRLLEKGDRVLLEGKLPLMITISPMFIQTGYVAVNRLRKISDDEIIRHQVSSKALLENKKVSSKSVSFPKPRVKKGKKVDTKLSASDRMKMMMGTSKKKEAPSKIFIGTPEEAANRLMDFLHENDILDLK